MGQKKNCTRARWGGREENRSTPKTDLGEEQISRRHKEYPETYQKTK